MNIAAAKKELARIGRLLHSRGWVPATSGNFSLRLADGDIAITASGRDKGQLRPDDIMRIAADGSPRENQRPSAETALHTQLYSFSARIHCVLHTHSVRATLISERQPDGLEFRGLEILKAFSGVTSHEAVVRIPIFTNSQDIDALSQEVASAMQANGPGVAYLIAGHGLYTWGRSAAECLRHLEALEFLFDYHLLSAGLLSPETASAQPTSGRLAR